MISLLPFNKFVACHYHFVYLWLRFRKMKIEYRLNSYANWHLLHEKEEDDYKVYKWVFKVL